MGLLSTLLILLFVGNCYALRSKLRIILGYLQLRVFKNGFVGACSCNARLFRSVTHLLQGRPLLLSNRNLEARSAKSGASLPYAYNPSAGASLACGRVLFASTCSTSCSTRFDSSGVVVAGVVISRSGRSYLVGTRSLHCCVCMPTVAFICVRINGQCAVAKCFPTYWLSCLQGQLERS